MDISAFLATPMPAKATLGALAVSVVAAIATAVLAYMKDRSLAAANRNYQTQLEGTKARLQEDLQRQKDTAQDELEGKKAAYQRELEATKKTLQSELEEKKLELQKQLAEFNAKISDDLAAQNARRAYEYDAKKRLYAQVEPLLFQLFEAAEGAFHAVTSLARTQRKGNLPEWLGEDEDKYYIHSIIHRLFLPLAILRLIQRTTTLIDLNLDTSIRLRYGLLKQAYLTWTDDFGLAEVKPELKYEPNEEDWEQKRKDTPARYWRQGLVIGSVDRLVDAMTVEGNDKSPARPMNFGEWDVAVGKNATLKRAYEDAADIFIDFDFRNRPVLGRVLITYACMMDVLMSVYADPTKPVDLQQLDGRLAELCADPEKQVGTLKWWNPGERDVAADIAPYLKRRCRQAIDGGYAKF